MLPCAIVWLAEWFWISVSAALHWKSALKLEVEVGHNTNIKQERCLQKVKACYCSK